jgi:hypothetical protein
MASVLSCWDLTSHFRENNASLLVEQIALVHFQAVLRRLSGRSANPDCHSGSSKASPINFFTFQGSRK